MSSSRSVRKAQLPANHRTRSALYRPSLPRWSEALRPGEPVCFIRLECHLRKSISLSAMALAAVLALGGCATQRSIDVPSVKPSPIKSVELKKTIGLSTQDEELLIGGAQISDPQVLETGEPLPDVGVPALNFSDARAVDVLSALSVATGVAITYADEGDALKARKVTVRGLSRRLPQLMSELSDLMGFYYTFENGTLKVSSAQQFIVPVPPVNDLMASLPQMVSHLGATNVFLDKSSRTLTYDASKPVNKRVAAYLKYIRDNASLIVYEAYIWDVTLADSSAMGIKWNQLQFGFGPMGSKGTRIGSNNITGGTLGATQGSGTGSSGTTSAGGLGTEVVYSGANFSLDVLLSFLQSQGDVTAISQPRLALVSGGTAQFEDGQSIQYVSRVGAVVGTNTTLSSSETDTVFTGLQMGMSGDVSDGTVYSDVNVSLGQLIRFNTFPSVDGSSQQLPQTSMQQVKTKVRARSGDTIILAGVNTVQYSGDKTGVPGLAGNSLLTSMDKSNTRRELVMVLQPRIIRFRHADDVVKAPVQSASAPVEQASAPAAASAPVPASPAAAPVSKEKPLASADEIEAKAKAIASHADTPATE
ncbi:type II secretion system protein GspD [Paraburkholderia sp. EG287A]|uniref:type II secretion system protein GspD n=1 Tax=Paraburkholderia sp. EG287A TaxID=3237012 RepID=UPI0034D298DE